jgi:hypothetical protein
MLARRLTTILPAMRLAEALETTCIHRVAGLMGARTALVTTRPFRHSACHPSAMGTDDGDYRNVKRGGHHSDILSQVSPILEHRAPGTTEQRGHSLHGSRRRSAAKASAPRSCRVYADGTGILDRHRAKHDQPPYLSMRPSLTPRHRTSTWRTSPTVSRATMTQDVLTWAVAVYPVYVTFA